MSEQAQILDALNKLNARLDAIERKVELVGTLSERLPVVADAAGHMAGLAFQAAEDQGIDPLEVIAESQDMAPDVIRIAAKAARREQLELLELLLDNGDLLRLAIGAGQKLKASGALDDATIGVAVDASTALVETKGGPIDKVGPFGVLGSIFDADIQTAIGFTMGIAKKFGARLAGR